MARARTLEEQTNSLALYLPTGRAWTAKNIEGTVTRGLLEGLAGELLRASALVEEFREEILPDRTVLFLDEWESALKIPDDCFTGVGTDDERRRDILAKLASYGIQSAEDFRRLALLVYGIELEIRNPVPDPGNRFPYTFNPTGEADPDGDGGEFLFNLSGREARFQIIIEYQNLPAAILFPYTFPLSFLTREIAVIECLFAKLRPANVGFTQEILIPSESPVPPPAPPGFTKQLNSLLYDDTFSMLTPGADNKAVGITGTFSMAIWAKNSEASPAGNDGLMAVRGSTAANAIDFACAVGSNDDVQLNIVNSTPSTRQNIVWAGVVDGDTDTWHLYVVTWDGESTSSGVGPQLFVDGVLVTTGITHTTDLDDTGMTDASRGIRVGLRVTAGDRWTGPIYSAGLYDKVLDSTEVEAMYNGGNARDFNLQVNSGSYVSAVNLIHYYRLGIGSDDTEFGLDVGNSLEGSELNMDTLGVADASDLTTDIPL